MTETPETEVPMPDDTKPPKPPHERPTLPELASANDTDRPPSAGFGVPDAIAQLTPIPAGEAQHAFAAALDDLQRAFALVEAVGMAAARALDAQATEGT
jgi:hypothetical protein